MLNLQHATQARRHQRPRIGLALAGGGPLGAIYELGALCALDESIPDIRLRRLDVYVGVSAGSFIAANLANRMSPAQLARIFMSRADAELPFQPDTFLRPAYREYLRGAGRLPGIVWQVLRDIARDPRPSALSESLNSFAHAVPGGVFDNEVIYRFLHEALNRPGRTDDFNQLDTRLFIVAVELDTGKAVRFGGPGHDDVSISRAVQASAALPGLYPPVTIKGRDYVDGALRRTLHASVALRHGIDLLLAINPLVPYQPDDDTAADEIRLSRQGLPMIMSQTFRSLIQSRMQIGISTYADEYPAAGIMLVEPNRNDREMFFTNVFSYSSRNRLCEHAFQQTRAELRDRGEEVNRLLGHYGLRLDEQRLLEPGRTLEQSLDEAPNYSSTVGRSLGRALEDLEDSLQKRNVATD